MRTSPLGYALLMLVLSMRALASSDTEFDTYEAYVQPDVLRVRASASADAPILTRLPINYPMLVVGAPSAEGFVEIEVKNQEVIHYDGNSMRGFVRADMLGKQPQTEQRVAQAKRLLEPRPTVIGVCFQGRVSILAQLVGNKLESLVETVENTERDSPEVRAAEARLRARALELTTLRFTHFRGGWLQEGYLVQARVVTELDVGDTAWTRIELGPCPQFRGETTVVNAHVFVSAPLEQERAPSFSGAELAPYIARLPSPVSELRVITPPGRFIELNTTGAVYLFQKGKPEVWACSSDMCPGRRLTGTHVPVWLRLASGQQLRIGSQTEDVDNTGWGTPANSGLWVSPEFVIHVFDAKGGVVEARVTLNQYGC
ncbi:hypothetical protein [Archangium sp.]|uniref:hypothetical protein n=1 Tax=Archangium sp. TaxID=1872627 RepID=UPI00286A6413|nr:hypothetical protein [Archangium sp.]